MASHRKFIREPARYESWDFLKHPDSATPKQTIGAVTVHTRHTKRPECAIRPAERRHAIEEQKTMKAARTAALRREQIQHRRNPHGDIIGKTGADLESQPQRRGRRQPPSSSKHKSATNTADFLGARFHAPMSAQEVAKRANHQTEYQKMHPQRSSLLGNCGRPDIPSYGVQDAFLWETPLESVPFRSSKRSKAAIERATKEEWR